MNAAREAWFEGQLELDPTRIVFIDETAANTKMAALTKKATDRATMVSKVLNLIARRMAKSSC